MLKIGNPKTFEKAKILFYGRPGTGKTVLVGSADAYTDTSKMLFLSVESGESVLKKHYPNVKVVSIGDYKDFNEAYLFIRNHAQLLEIYRNTDSDEEQKKIAQALHDLEYNTFGDNPAEPTIYKSVGIDTLTEVQQYSMSFVKGEDLKSKSLLDISTNKISDWNHNNESMNNLIRMFRNLPIHVIMASHVKEVQNKENGEISMIPMLSGKLASNLAGFFDIVGYMDTFNLDEQVRLVENGVLDEVKEFCNVAYFSPNQVKCDGKSRYPLSSYMILPTIEKIVEEIKGGLA